ncbi:MAG: hypothetical protein PHU25_05125 [Deltaproteobacteria bacterium]|nr:hypothetical protein [Deltaproteobacteria bacterium]
MGQKDSDEDEDATVPFEIGEPEPILCPTCECPLEDPYGTGILLCPKCGLKP